MKPANFDYHTPSTLPEAAALVASLPDAKLLAGGQTLLPMMNFRFMTPENIIDLNGVQELAGISVQGDRLQIGAMTRQRDIEQSPLVRRVAPLVAEAYGFVAHRQIRNRGTYGGSLCHLDPASEQPCFTSALGGILTVVKCEGGRIRARHVAIADWAQMYLTPALEEGELLQSISLEIWPVGHGYSFQEYSRRHGDFAIVGVAALTHQDARGRLERVAVSVCGVAPGPVRLGTAERDLVGMAPGEEAVAVASEAARCLDVMSDQHITADYRQHLAATLTGRALRAAFARMSPPSNGTAR